MSGRPLKLLLEVNNGRWNTQVFWSPDSVCVRGGRNPIPALLAHIGNTTVTGEARGWGLEPITLAGVNTFQFGHTILQKGAFMRSRGHSVPLSALKHQLIYY